MSIAVAPVLHYTPSNSFTPTHRAQLSRSHKKVEQILGVSPSVRPFEPIHPQPTSISTSAKRLKRRSKSCATISTCTKKAEVKSKGRLRTLFGIPANHLLPNAPKMPLKAESTLYRVDSDTSISSVSSSSSTAALLEKPLPRLPRPRLQIDCTNLDRQTRTRSRNTVNLEDRVLDIRPNAHLVQNKVEVDEPSETPVFTLDLAAMAQNRKRSRYSIIEEQEWEKIVRGVYNLPIDPKEKARKLTRLGKVFGVMPPMEMVFPPSPNSRSRNDPSRYTFGLPPPLERPSMDIFSDRYEESENEKVMRVELSKETDEETWRRVTGALRMLRA